LRTTVFDTWRPHRVRTLESQISELEAEATRLLQTLDALKESRSESERIERKKADESAKEIASQVS
jgi:homeobox protein cut-like